MLLVVINRAGPIKQKVELFVREAHDIEVEVKFLKFTELDAEKLLIPSGVQCQPIVGNAQRFLLRSCEPLQANRRHFLHADRLRGHCSTVACNELVVFVDQNGICEPKLFDRFCDLLYLLVAVRSSISLVRLQIVNANVFDLRFLLSH